MIATLNISVPDPWHFGMDPDSYLWLTDPDPDGPKTYGSGTLLKLNIQTLILRHDRCNFTYIEEN